MSRFEFRFFWNFGSHEIEITMLNLYPGQHLKFTMKFGKYLENLILKAPASVEIHPEEIVEKITQLIVRQVNNLQKYFMQSARRQCFNF